MIPSYKRNEFLEPEESRELYRKAVRNKRLVQLSTGYLTFVSLIDYEKKHILRKNGQ